MKNSLVRVNVELSILEARLASRHLEQEYSWYEAKKNILYCHTWLQVSLLIWIILSYFLQEKLGYHRQEDGIMATGHGPDGN